MSAKKDGWGAYAFMFLIWLFWTAFTGVADVAVALQFVHQFWAYTYLPADGVLLERELKVEQEGDGPSYEAHVRYKYAVGGRDYEGTRIRFSYVSGGGKEFVEADLPAQKVGETIPVYYSPRDPNVAILRRGIPPLAWLIPVFLFPFNAISLAGVLWAVDRWRSRSLGRPWLGIKVRETDVAGTTIRFYEISPLGGAIFAAGAAGFVLTSVLLFLPGEWISPDSKAVLAWGGVFAAIVVALNRSRKMATTITCDPFRSQLIYRGPKGEREQVFDLESLAFITQRPTTSFDSDGDATSKTEIELTTQDDKSLPLTKNYREDDAKQLAIWLGEKLKLPVRTVDEMDYDDEDFGEEEEDEDGDDE